MCTLVTLDWPYSTQRVVLSENNSARGLFQDYTFVVTMLERTTVEYGIDEEGPVPDLQTNNHVVIPRSTIVLSDAEEAGLLTRVPNVFVDANFWMDVFSEVVNYLSEILSQ